MKISRKNNFRQKTKFIVRVQKKAKSILEFIESNFGFLGRKANVESIDERKEI